MKTPYIVSDVGGTSELVDLSRYSEAVVPKGDDAELAITLQTVLERGTLPVLPLRQEVGHQHRSWALSVWQLSSLHHSCARTNDMTRLVLSVYLC